MGKTAIWTISSFNVDNNQQKLCQAMLWVHNIVQGERGIYKHIF